MSSTATCLAAGCGFEQVADDPAELTGPVRDHLLETGHTLKIHHEVGDHEVGGVIDLPIAAWGPPATGSG